MRYFDSSSIAQISIHAAANITTTASSALVAIENLFSRLIIAELAVAMQDL